MSLHFTKQSTITWTSVSCLGRRRPVLDFVPSKTDDQPLSDSRVYVGGNKYVVCEKLVDVPCPWLECQFSESSVIRSLLRPDGTLLSPERVPHRRRATDVSPYGFRTPEGVSQTDTRTLQGPVSCCLRSLLSTVRVSLIEPYIETLPTLPYLWCLLLNHDVRSGHDVFGTLVSLFVVSVTGVSSGSVIPSVCICVSLHHVRPYTGHTPRWGTVLLRRLVCPATRLSSPTEYTWSSTSSLLLSPNINSVSFVV